jgi:hypothetical protein
MTNAIQQDDNQKQQARKKENNPFSEQEYQGNPSVQRRAPGIEDDNQDK